MTPDPTSGGIGGYSPIVEGDDYPDDGPISQAMLDAQLAVFLTQTHTWTATQTVLDSSLAVQQTGDSYPRIELRDDGTIALGDGASSADAGLAYMATNGIGDAPAVTTAFGNGFDTSLSDAYRFRLWGQAPGSWIDCIRGINASEPFIFGGVFGDSLPRIQLDHSGSIRWGDGASPVDTELTRLAANLLSTPGSLQVGGALGIDGLTSANGGVELDGALGSYLYLYGGADLYVQGTTAGASALGAQVDGDAGNRFICRVTGKHEYSDGSGIMDVVTERTGPGEYTIDADAAITGGFACNGATPPAQAAHIADPAGGATIDAEARTAINAILNIIESTGLMAP